MYTKKGAKDGGDGGCSQVEDFPEGETYLLPLGACIGEEKEAAEAGGYQLPLQCEVYTGIYILFCSCQRTVLARLHIGAYSSLPTHKSATFHQA